MKYCINVFLSNILLLRIKIWTCQKVIPLTYFLFTTNINTPGQMCVLIHHINAKILNAVYAS